jgi:hypothetical protein
MGDVLYNIFLVIEWRHAQTYITVFSWAINILNEYNKIKTIAKKT